MIVEVMLKPEIHDPQGEAIASACHRLGFGQVLGVRQGKRFEVELEGPADEAVVTAICIRSEPEWFARSYDFCTEGFGAVNGESLYCGHGRQDGNEVGT
jgi:phosphoribosylformylglycinamidine (FGAM) synthase PurS component